MEFDEGHFAGFRILAGGLAERGAVGGGVEDVVNDLKGEAEMAAGGAERGKRRRVGVRAKAAQDERSFDHGGGFVEMDEFEPGGGRAGFFLGEDVFHLPADEVRAAGGGGECAHERGGEAGRVVFDEEREGVGEQGVTGKNGGGLVELFVRGGVPAAKVVVVHRGQVVVDEGVSVHALDRHGGGQGIRRSRAGRKEFGGGEREHGAEALTAGLQGRAHGLMDAGRAGVVRRRGGRQQALDAGFDAGEVGV